MAMVLNVHEAEMGERLRMGFGSER